MFVAVVMFTTCQQDGRKAANAEGTDSLAADTMIVADTLVYEGEGPAADGTYQYSLSLYGDSIRGFAYEQVTVIPKDKETMARTTDVARLIENNGKNYVRVQSEKMDSVTFLQLNDQTLRLVSDKFEKAGEGTNTDLKLEKQIIRHKRIQISMPRRVFPSSACLFSRISHCM